MKALYIVNINDYEKNIEEKNPVQWVLPFLIHFPAEQFEEKAKEAVEAWLQTTAGKEWAKEECPLISHGINFGWRDLWGNITNDFLAPYGIEKLYELASLLLDEGLIGVDTLDVDFVAADRRKKGAEGSLAYTEPWK